MFVPITFVLISLYPASSSIGLTLPPAINPEPSAPGFNNTLAEPNVPRNSCGIVVPTIGTSIKFFLASSIAFLLHLELLLLFRFQFLHDRFRHQQQLLR